MYKGSISEQFCGCSKQKNLMAVFIDVQNAMVAPRDCVAGLQSLLLTVMSNSVRHFISKKYSDSQNADGIDEEQKSCFLDAAIGFCKLQHLDSTMSTKYQVSHGLQDPSLK